MKDALAAAENEEGDLEGWGDDCDDVALGAVVEPAQPQLRTGLTVELEVEAADKACPGNPGCPETTTEKGKVESLKDALLRMPAPRRPQVLNEHDGGGAGGGRVDGRFRGFR